MKIYSVHMHESRKYAETFSDTVEASNKKEAAAMAKKAIENQICLKITVDFVTEG